MVLRHFHTGIAVERTDTQAQIVRVFDLSLHDRRSTTPTKHPLIPRSVRFHFRDPPDINEGDH